MIPEGLGVLGGHPGAGGRVERAAVGQRAGHQLDGGARVQVMLLDVPGQVTRDVGIGGGDQQAALPRQVGQQIGDQVAEHARVAESALAVVGDHRAERLAGLPLGVELFGHGLVVPRLSCFVSHCC